MFCLLVGKIKCCDITFEFSSERYGIVYNSSCVSILTQKQRNIQNPTTICMCSVYINNCNQNV